MNTYNWIDWFDWGFEGKRGEGGVNYNKIVINIMDLKKHVEMFFMIIENYAENFWQIGGSMYMYVCYWGELM